MKYPSKKHAAVMKAEAAKKLAHETNDADGFVAAIKALKEAESQPDIYLCICCGTEFPDGPHADLLIASIVIFGDNGFVTDFEDYGITSTRRDDRSGRRFKICSKCVKKWKHHPLEYAELR